MDIKFNKNVPELDQDAPAFYQWFIYPDDNTDATRIGCGLKAINVRDPDLIFDRPYIAEQLGATRVMRSAEGDGTMFGTGGDRYRFAPQLLVSDKSLNADDPEKPVYRMRFVGRPEGRWNSFPYRPDFDMSTDTLSPVASKVELYRSDKSLIDVIEHYPSRVDDKPGSGLPFNFHGQWCNDDQNNLFAGQKPVEPWFTCQMTLSWQSARYVPSKYLNHLHPGVELSALDATQVMQYDAWPDQWPVVTGNYLSNGLQAHRVAPKWSRKEGSGFDTEIIDTVFQGGWRDNYRTQIIGTDHTPGATQQHTPYASPGGSRHDRGMWPHITVTWLTAQDGIRVHGAVPNAHLQHQWNLGYHNEGCHYFTNPELGITLDKEDIKNGRVAYNDTYYNGGREDFRDEAHSIRLLAQGNAVHNNPYRDKNGRQFVCEYQRDDQHNISNAAQMLYFNNDPMGAFEARDSFNSAILATFGMSRGFSKSDFLNRQHAWYFKHLVEMWVVANNSRDGFNSADIEFMASNHLGWVVDAVLPAITAPQSFTDMGLRDLGLPCAIYYAAAPSSGASLGVYDSKAFYFANELMFAKQSGFLDRMREISPKNSQGIDLIVNGLCKGSVDYFMDSNGRSDNQYDQFIPFDTANPPAKFDWTMYPVRGQQDWIHKPDGTIDGNYPEGYNTQHYRAQFLWVIKYFLTEYSYPRADAAIEKVRAWYDVIEARKNAGGNNWHYKFAMMSIPNAPKLVGAPTLLPPPPPEGNTMTFKITIDGFDSDVQQLAPGAETSLTSIRIRVMSPDGSAVLGESSTLPFSIGGLTDGKYPSEIAALDSKGAVMGTPATRLWDSADAPAITPQPPVAVSLPSAIRGGIAQEV